MITALGAAAFLRSVGAQALRGRLAKSPDHPLLFLLFCGFLLALWLGCDGELRLRWLADAVRAEVDTPTDEATNQDIAEGPSVNGLRQHDVVELVVFRRYLNTLSVYMVSIRFHDSRKAHVYVRPIFRLDGHRLWNVTIDGNLRCTACHNRSTR